jgi:uncharacterized iron-regulated membrane protein
VPEGFSKGRVSSLPSVARAVRRGLFWLHLVLGVTFGLAVVPVAATGALIAFQPELTAYFESDVHVVDMGAPRLPPTELLRRAALELPSGTRASSLQLECPRTAPAILGTEAGFWLLDPYQGHVLRRSNIRRFFLATEEVHWTVGLILVGLRPVGTALVGLVTVAVLLLALSGPWMWWSRRVTWAQRRQRLGPSTTSPPAQGTLCWHRRLGLWCAPVLLAASLTGILLHFDAARAGVGAVLGRTGEARVGLDADSAVREAVARAPDWSAVRLWWADDGEMTLRVRLGRGARPTQWAELDASAFAGTSLRRYQDGRLGDRLLGWARWLHTGQALGWPGQALWGLGALGLLVLVWTGLTLAVLRLLRWRAKASAHGPG